MVGLCLALLPPVPAVLSYSGSVGGRGDHNSRSALLKVEGLTKTQIAGPTPRISDSADLGCGPMTCNSDKFLGDAGVVALGAPL